MRVSSAQSILKVGAVCKRALRQAARQRKFSYDNLPLSRQLRRQRLLLGEEGNLDEVPEMRQVDVARDLLADSGELGHGRDGVELLHLSFADFPEAVLVEPVGGQRRVVARVQETSVQVLLEGDCLPLVVDRNEVADLAIELVATDAKTGGTLYRSGPTYGTTYVHNRTVLFIGWYTTDTSFERP